MNAALAPLLIFAPTALPFIAAALCLLVLRSLRAQQVIAGVTFHAMLAVACVLLHTANADGTQVLRIADWPGTFGIVWAVDRLAAVMLLLTSVLLCATYWYSISGAIGEIQQKRFFHPLVLTLGAGVSWAFTTTDLFNLFVGFELILLCTYGLLCHSNEKTQIREGYKFAVLNIVAGMIFLAAAGLTYGTFGTLNFADLAIKVEQTGQYEFAAALGMLLFVVFGLKAAVFPLFFWMPDAYPKAPVGLFPLFSGILTKVGVYCLYRVFPLVFPEHLGDVYQPLLLALAGLTMLVGVLGALSQWTFRHILAFHSMSQIGYMLFGLALFTPLGLAGGIFFIIHHALVKSSLFLVAGIVILRDGSDSLKKAKGLLQAHPALAALFLIAAFSLAGLPPTTGFFGKYALILEGFFEGRYLTTTASILTSLLTLASMVKIWTYSFMGERPEGARLKSSGKGMTPVLVGMVLLLVLVPLTSGPIMRLCEGAADDLLERTSYIEMVTGTSLGPAAGPVALAPGQDLPPWKEASP